jgi:hypothetical protein
MGRSYRKLLSHNLRLVPSHEKTVNPVRHRTPRRIIIIGEE